MDAQAKAVVRECTTGSDEERVTFPEVAMKLMAAGIERYHADLTRAEKTYYMPDGSSEVVPTLPLAAETATDFSTAGVEAAVRAIQARTIGYKTFCERIMA